MFIQLIIICILFNFIKNINAKKSCNISDSEYNALYIFYTSTNGSYWNNNIENNQKWIFPSDLNQQCTTTTSLWFGLTCIVTNRDSGLCSIQEIKLSSNNLQGSITKEIENFQSLINLNLQINHLSGSIPSELGNLVQLTKLFLDTNHLSGSIPSELGNLVDITFLSLIYNQLSGSIPSELGNLVQLAHLFIDTNHLIGSIPSELGNLVELIGLYLDNNRLSGSIPSELGNLVKLNYLYLDTNHLSGSIPSELGNLVDITFLGLFNNQLSGSIPFELGNLVDIRYLSLHNNHLSGSIPSELGNLVQLTKLYFYNNHLIGSIPSELGNLVQLIKLYFYNNQLSGSIPSELGNLVDIHYLVLFNNHLSGSIPSELGNLVDIRYLVLDTNHLSGSIPSELGNLVQLTKLYFYNNHLIGSIPSELGNLFNLTYLYFDTNQLSGSIPSELGNLTSLKYLDFSNNFLTGSIPISFNQLYQLQTLFLTNNSLNGNLDGIFNSYALSKLKNIDLIGNRLSGSIPSFIFDISSLETFAVSNNCIKGSLPKEICSSITLQSLILDGLHSKCGTRIFPLFLPINTFYASSDVIIGGIPTCVFNMINLITLQVSGNSINGKLDKDIVLSNKLINLDLSTNLYNGDIPNVIQNKQWNYLNLGFNKFKDTINDINSNPYNQSNQSTTLNLQNNRISGSIPLSLSNSNSFSNISILDGNIFSCSSILPSNDNLSTEYQCGTIQFYNLLLIFSIITIIIVLIKLRFYKDDDNKIQNVWYKNINRLRIIGKEINNLSIFRPSLSSSLSNSKDDCDDDIIRISDDLSSKQDSNITLLLIVSENIQQCLIYIIIFNICLWLLSSTILHQYYSTYDFMYGYNLSMTFLSGYPSAIILILLIIISIIFIYNIINRYFFQSIIFVVNDKDDDNNKIKKVKDDDNNKIKKVKDDDKFYKSNHFWMLLLVLTINLLVMIVINGFYVMASLDPINYPNIELIAILVSIFKTGWKSFVLPLLLSILITNDDDNDKIKLINNNNEYSMFNVVFQCIIGILNIIVIPLLTTSFLATNCFKYAIVPQPSILSSYEYHEIVISDTTGFQERVLVTRTSSYQPPFAYSYQCSSTLMTTYDSVYITMSILLILESLLTPFIKVCYRKIEEYERIKKIMNKLLPSKLKPLQSSFTNSIKEEKEDKVEKEEDIKEESIFMKCYKKTNKNGMKAILFHQTRFIVDIVIFMSLTVTIGFILPLVGIIICISLYLYIHSILSNIGGKLTNATINDKEILEKECENLVDNLNINLNRYTYPIMGIFFSLFVFDIIGDKEGSDVAIWYLIFTLLIPLILWLIKYIYTLYSDKKSTQKEEKVQEGISLQNIVKNSEVNNPLNIMN